MQNPLIRVAFVVTALASPGLFLACDASPTSPTRRTLTTLEIAGPEIIPLGSNVQFRAIAHVEGSFPRDVTNEVRWRVRPGTVVSISEAGLIAGREPGDTRVIADFGVFQGAKDVIVLPDGTHRLIGTVLDADARVGVPDALVEVTAGVGTGMTIRTNQQGEYRLYGVAGETVLRIMRDGYREIGVTVFVADHRAVRNLEMTPLLPRPSVSGNYTLTITAAHDCAVGTDGRLPEETRVRTYQVVVRQEGTQLEITVRGSDIRYGLFFGTVEPGRVLFNLAWYDDSGEPEPAIYEELSTSDSLSIRGDAETVGSADRLAGTLRGDLRLYPTRGTWWRPTAQCISVHHQFVLTRP